MSYSEIIISYRWHDPPSLLQTRTCTTKPSSIMCHIYTFVPLCTTFSHQPRVAMWNDREGSNDNIFGVVEEIALLLTKMKRVESTLGRRWLVEYQRWAEGSSSQSQVTTVVGQGRRCWLSFRRQDVNRGGAWAAPHSYFRREGVCVG